MKAAIRPGRPVDFPLRWCCCLAIVVVTSISPWARAESPVAFGASASDSAAVQPRPPHCSPTLITSWNVYRLSGWVGVVGNDLTVGNDDALWVINASDQWNPLPGSWGGVLTDLPIDEVTVSGTNVFVSTFNDCINPSFCGYGGVLELWNLADPMWPVRMDRKFLPFGGFGRVAARGKFAFAPATDGLRVYDVSGGVLAQVGLASSTFGCNDASLSGSVLVATCGKSLRVFGVSDPLHPVELGSVALPDWAQHLTRAFNLAYVATGSGLAVVDVSNPSAPVIRGKWGTGPIRGIPQLALGGRCYVAADATGVVALDVSVPSTPVMIGKYQTATPAIGVALAGNVAWVVSEYSDQLEAVDVTSCRWSIGN